MHFGAHVFFIACTLCSLADEIDVIAVKIAHDLLNDDKLRVRFPLRVAGNMPPRYFKLSADAVEAKSEVLQHGELIHQIQAVLPTESGAFSDFLEALKKSGDEGLAKKLKLEFNKTPR
jgi:hypothetical protein